MTNSNKNVTFIHGRNGRKNKKEERDERGRRIPSLKDSRKKRLQATVGDDTKVESPKMLEMTMQLRQKYSLKQTN